jgi:VanZ family protein
MEASTTGRMMAWVLLVLMAVINVAGYAFDLYRQFWWFDRVLHATTILAVTLWLALFVFGRVFEVDPPRPVLTFLLLASTGIAIGALWEVAEWAYDQAVPGDAIKGKYDSILDIIMDTLGASLAGIAAVRLLRPRGTHRTD